VKRVKIGFSKSKKNLALFSWAVRVYQRTKFSHIYIILETPFLGSDTVTHASEGKVLSMSDYQFNKRHEVIEEILIEVSEENYNEMLLELHKVSGDDYGVMQNIGILLVDLLNSLNIKIKNPWQQGWNCSEFVCVMLQKCKPELVENIDPQTVTPKQLYNLLKKEDKNES